MAHRTQPSLGGHGAATYSAAPAPVSLLHSPGAPPNRPAFLLLIKSSLRRNWVLVGIARRSGALQFSFSQGRDVFPTWDAAMGYQQRKDPLLEVLATGVQVLGFVKLGATGLLLLAEKLRTATLPANHVVKTVTASRWHRVPLQEPGSPGPAFKDACREEQARNIEHITKMPLDGLHYFCETLDLTRPFPSDKPVTLPSWEFVWNRWLSSAWRCIGMDHICPPLLQGMCEVRSLHDFDNKPYQVALMSRRSRLHVGPRYKARGLNDVAEPANEIECEQIIWRLQPSDDYRTAPIQWSRYSWRRGSVPLHWGVTLHNGGMGPAEIFIKPTGTFKGSRRYFRRLQKRFAPDPRLDACAPDPDDAAMTTVAAAATSRPDGATTTATAAASSPPATIRVGSSAATAVSRSSSPVAGAPADISDRCPTMAAAKPRASASVGAGVSLGGWAGIVTETGPETSRGLEAEMDVGTSFPPVGSGLLSPSSDASPTSPVMRLSGLHEGRCGDVGAEGATLGMQAQASSSHGGHNGHLEFEPQAAHGSSSPPLDARAPLHISGTHSPPHAGKIPSPSHTKRYSLSGTTPSTTASDPAVTANPGSKDSGARSPDPTSVSPDPSPKPLNSSPKPPDPSLNFPIVYVSLLRKGMLDKEKSETKLASAFDAMAGALLKHHRLPLTYIPNDWHDNDSKLGHEETVEGFWHQIKGLLPQHGFALGVMEKTGLDHCDTSSLPEDVGYLQHAGKERLPPRTSTAGRGWTVRWFRQQRGLMRYNCADSLDRTNVSSFFGAIQVLVEQCRELDIAIAFTPKGVDGMAAMLRSSPSPSQTQVPPASPRGFTLLGNRASRPGSPRTSSSNGGLAASCTAASSSAGGARGGLVSEINSQFQLLRNLFHGTSVQAKHKHRASDSGPGLATITASPATVTRAMSLSPEATPAVAAVAAAATSVPTGAADARTRAMVAGAEGVAATVAVAGATAAQAATGAAGVVATAATAGTVAGLAGAAGAAAAAAAVAAGLPGAYGATALRAQSGAAVAVSPGGTMRPTCSDSHILETLPPGWVAKRDQYGYFYVDNNTRTTTRVHPGMAAITARLPATVAGAARLHGAGPSGGGMAHAQGGAVMVAAAGAGDMHVGAGGMVAGPQIGSQRAAALQGQAQAQRPAHANGPAPGQQGHVPVPLHGQHSMHSMHSPFEQNNPNSDASTSPETCQAVFATPRSTSCHTLGSRRPGQASVVASWTGPPGQGLGSQQLSLTSLPCTLLSTPTQQLTCMSPAPSASPQPCAGEPSAGLHPQRSTGPGSSARSELGTEPSATSPPFFPSLGSQGSTPSPPSFSPQHSPAHAFSSPSALGQSGRSGMPGREFCSPSALTRAGRPGGPDRVITSPPALAQPSHPRMTEHSLAAMTQAGRPGPPEAGAAGAGRRGTGGCPSPLVATPRTPHTPGGSVGTASPSPSIATPASDRRADHHRAVSADRDERCWEPLSPWCMLGASVPRFRKRIKQGALTAMAELFLLNGDLSALLYTGSQAMHSERMLLFEPADSKLRAECVGRFNGMMVAIQRRINNVWEDDRRQMQLDLFLGLNTEHYFPLTHALPPDQGLWKCKVKELTDYPDSDDEADPVGHMCWPPKDRRPSEVPEGAAGSPGVGSHHKRSFSSQELLSSWGGRGSSPLSPHLSAKPHAAASAGSLILQPSAARELHAIMERSAVSSGSLSPYCSAVAAGSGGGGGGGGGGGSSGKGMQGMVQHAASCNLLPLHRSIAPDVDGDDSGSGGDGGAAGVGSFLSTMAPGAPRSADGRIESAFLRATMQGCGDGSAACAAHGTSDNGKPQDGMPLTIAVTAASGFTSALMSSHPLEAGQHPAAVHRTPLLHCSPGSCTLQAVGGELPSPSHYCAARHRAASATQPAGTGQGALAANAGASQVAGLSTQLSPHLREASKDCNDAAVSHLAGLGPSTARQQQQQQPSGRMRLNSFPTPSASFPPASSPRPLAGAYMAGLLGKPAHGDRGAEALPGAAPCSPDQALSPLQHPDCTQGRLKQSSSATDLYALRYGGSSMAGVQSSMVQGGQGHGTSAGDGQTASHDQTEFAFAAARGDEQDDGAGAARISMPVCRA